MRHGPAKTAPRHGLETALLQLNNAAGQVSGFTSLLLRDGVNSHGSLLQSTGLSRRLMDAGVDVSARATRN